MRWAAKSPDLNPIKNLWGILVYKVYEHGRQFETIHKLKKSVLKAWKEIKPEILKILVSSMKDRCISVLERKGELTEY